ncbi:MAG: S41 family peptidase [Bacteroidetes bacterium]|nr:S41 family peptidase [Bacteroidota bacterium]
MKRSKCILFFFLLTPILAHAQTNNGAAASGKYFDIAKNLEIFANAFKEINHGYVDELDPGQVMRRGLDAMLEGLDPFTNYISETDIEGYRIQSDARYNGIGASGAKMGDYMVVTEIFENSPAHKAGLKVGDAVVAIDGISARGKTEKEVLDFLRGFPGTETILTLRRPGSNKDLQLTLKREEVEVPNVPHFGIVAEHIGYINLTTFTQNAGGNIANAFQKLKERDPALKGAILDLRNNGGGLLNEAVNIINLFVPRGLQVVSTHGKVLEWDNIFKTQSEPLDKNIPLVVLVNKHSASASEVVSGSLQDLDRAVIMGQRTYGKGLVQNTRDVGYNAKIKLTTAKYYIPSGRCIQATRYKDGVPVDIPESERAQFRTNNGRLVLDGGGIKPDVLLPVDTASNYVNALLKQNILFDYVTQWCVGHPSIDSIEVFEFRDWDNFTQFLRTSKFEYTSASERKIRELATLVGQENYPLDAEISALEAKLQAAKQADLNKNKARIVHEIEQEIVGRYYFQRGKVRKSLKNDAEVEAAVQLLNDVARYKSILGSK